MKKTMILLCFAILFSAAILPLSCTQPEPADTELELQSSEEQAAQETDEGAVELVAVDEAEEPQPLAVEVGFEREMDLASNVERSNARAHSGNYSGMVSTEPRAPHVLAEVGDQIPLRDVQSLNCTVWTYVEEIENGVASFRLVYYDDQDKVAGQARLLQIGEPSNQWQRHDLATAEDIPLGASYAKIQLGLRTVAPPPEEPADAAEEAPSLEGADDGAEMIVEEGGEEDGDQAALELDEDEATDLETDTVDAESAPAEEEPQFVSGTVYFDDIRVEATTQS